MLRTERYYLYRIYALIKGLGCCAIKHVKQIKYVSLKYEFQYFVSKRPLESDTA